LLPETEVQGERPAPPPDFSPVQDDFPAPQETLDVPTSLTTPSISQALEDLSRQAGAAALIDQSDLLKGKVSNQEDLFRQTPGVWVTSQNNGDDVFISIRGSGLSNRGFGRGVNSFVDGVIPMGRLDAGTTNQLLNLLANQYVEVFRGGNALEFGATTLGGIVNYVPYTGYTAPSAVYRTEFGPNSYFRNWIAGGNVVDNADYFVSLDTIHYDGFRDQSVNENYRLHFNVGWQTEDFSTRYYVFSNRARLELPGVITKQQAFENFRQAGTLNSIVDTDRNWQNLRAANKSVWLLSDTAQVTTGVWAGIDALDHLPTPFVGIIRNQYTDVGGTIRYEDNGTLFDHDNRFLFGARFGYADISNNRYRYFDNGEVPDKNQPVFDGASRAHQAEVFVQDAWSVRDDFRIVLGAQFFHTDRTFHDRLFTPLPPAVPPFPPQPNVTAGDQSFERNYDQFNPKIGFTHDLNEQLIMYGNVSRSAEAPSLEELTDRAAFAFIPAFASSVQAQTAWTSELGVRGIVLDSVQIDAAYYYSFINDELLFQQGPFPNTTAVFNAPRTRHEGVELGMRTNLFEGLVARGIRPENQDRLQLIGVYNWSNFHFHNDPNFGNNRLPGIPEHTLFLSLDYFHPWGLSLGANMRCVDRYGLTFDGTGGNNFQINGYTLFDLRAGFRPNDRMYFYCDFRNIGDRLYLADGTITPTASGPFALVTPGINRALYFGFEYRR